MIVEEALPYVWSQTALHYVSMGSRNGRHETTHTKVIRLATRAHAPATMMIARANRAPVPPDKSMGCSSGSALPTAMLGSSGRGGLSGVVCKSRQWRRYKVRQCQQHEAVIVVVLQIATCSGLVLVWPRWWRWYVCGGLERAQAS
jgi:hypothetical protein